MVQISNHFRQPAIRKSTDPGSHGKSSQPLQRLDKHDLDAVSRSLKGVRAKEIMLWAVDHFAPDIALSCSFGGPSGMVLLDMAAQLDVTDNLEIYYLDTGLLFAETYDLVGEVRRRYGFQISAYSPDQTLPQQAETYGARLWETNPDLCCSLRKVEPNFTALEGKKCWITGVRRDQSPGRSKTTAVSWKPGFGIVKVNPLAEWSESQVWNYVRMHNVPYNPLHDSGYPSLGCTVCTRPVAPGSVDMRSGRWPGFGKSECGLHLNG